MRLTLLSTVSALVLFGLALSPAHAAFEFVSPQATKASAPAPDMVEEAAPVVNNSPVIEGMDLPAPMAASETPVLPAAMPSPQNGEPMPLMMPKSGSSAVKLTPIAHDSDALVVENRAPVPAGPTPIRTTPMQVPAEFQWTQQEPSGDDQGAVVQGFGRDVPLVLALQQIVPPNYRYSFDPGIDPGLRVKWTGGQPWKNVIMELARSHNMNVDIVSNVVAFRKNGYNDAPVAPMPMTSPVVASATELPPIIDAPMPVVSTPVLPVDMPAEAPAKLTPVISEPARTARPAAKSQDDMRNTLTAARQEATFDPLLGLDKPARTEVKDKKILTADSETSAMMAPVSQDIVMQPLMPELAAPKPMPAPVAPAAPRIAAPVNDFMPAPVLPPVNAAHNDVTPMPMVPNASVGMNDMPPVDAYAVVGSPIRKADMATAMSWEARKGQTLRQALTAWSEYAGVSLVWSSEYDYPLQTDVRIDANYTDAVKTLLAGFSKAQPRPLGRLFNNSQSGAQAVLIVETQRLTN